MKDGENLDNIVEGIKKVENGVNSAIIPILKDTISDYKDTIKKLFVIIVIQIIALTGVVVYSIYLHNQDSKKYLDFINQFDFETSVYQETDNESIINSGINVTK